MTLSSIKTMLVRVWPIANRQLQSGCRREQMVGMHCIDDVKAMPLITPIRVLESANPILMSWTTNRLGFEPAARI